MSLIITIVAVVNLAAGFALGTYLALGGFPAGPAALPPKPVPGLPSAAPIAPTATAPAPATAPAAATAPPPTTEKTPSAAAAAPSAASPVEVSIDEVKTELNRYREQLAQLGRQIRQCATAPEEKSAKQCVAGLTVANSQYVERQSQAAGKLAAISAAADAQTAALGSRLAEEVTKQAEEVRSATDRLSKIDLSKDLKQGCQSLLGESTQLADSNYALCDSLEEARLELSPNGESPDQDDSLGGKLIGKARWEAVLAKRLEAEGGRAAALTVAVVDVDRVRQLNEQHGEALVDQLLPAVCKSLVEDMREQDIAGRHSGQRFLLLLPDTTARDGTTALERMRQRIEATEFRRGAQPMRVSVSGAVAEAAPGDTVSALVERAESTLKAAKQFGRNRTFKYEGRQPAPVVPPQLGIESQVVLL